MAGELASRIGSNFSDYTGNAALGGSTAQVFNINTRPFENLAAYTFAYKTKLYDQKQKDLVARAKELASFTEYDLTNAVPKYGEQIRTKFSELKDWVVNNMDVLDYNNNPKGYLEYKKRRNELSNDIRDGAVQEILYDGATKAAEAETNPAMKAFILRQRDEQVAANDIRTPIVINKYDVVKPATKAPPLKEFDVTVQQGDFKADRKLSKIDMKSLKAQAFAIGLGLAGDVLNESDPNFINLPDEVKKLKREEYKAKQASGRLSIIDEAQTYNEALAKYKDEEGNVDLIKLKSNPILFPLIERFDAYNKYVNNEKANIIAGSYKDKGIALQFGLNGGLDEADYQELNFLDGVTPEELAAAEIFSKAPPEKIETDVDYTGAANKRADLAIEKFKAETGRISANKKEPKDAATIVIDKPAILFGEHIDRVKKYFSAHPNEGNLSIPYEKVDDKTRIAAKLTAGQFIIYKPDGSYVVSTDRKGKTVSSVGTIENLAQGFIDAVKTIDLGAADKDGTMAEGFQIKSEAKFNELFGTTSGKYIWDNWGDTKQNSSQPEATEPEYSREDYKAAGWTDKQIEIALKAGKIKVK